MQETSSLYPSWQSQLSCNPIKSTRSPYRQSPNNGPSSMKRARTALPRSLSSPPPPSCIYPGRRGHRAHWQRSYHGELPLRMRLLLHWRLRLCRGLFWLWRARMMLWWRRPKWACRRRRILRRERGSWDCWIGGRYLMVRGLCGLSLGFWWVCWRLCLDSIVMGIVSWGIGKWALMGFVWLYCEIRWCI